MDRYSFTFKNKPKWLVYSQLILIQAFVAVYQRNSNIPKSMWNKIQGYAIGLVLGVVVSWLVGWWSLLLLLLFPIGLLEIKEGKKYVHDRSDPMLTMQIRHTAVKMGILGLYVGMIFVLSQLLVLVSLPAYIGLTVYLMRKEMNKSPY